MRECERERERERKREREREEERERKEANDRVRDIVGTVKKQKWQRGDKETDECKHLMYVGRAAEREGLHGRERNTLTGLYTTTAHPSNFISSSIPLEVDTAKRYSLSDAASWGRKRRERGEGREQQWRERQGCEGGRRDS
jgi:hypothetical protein